MSETTYEHLARRSTDDDLARLLAKHREAMDKAQAQMGMHATICSAIYDEQRRRRDALRPTANDDYRSSGGAE